jgi:hypothetical protein
LLSLIAEYKAPAAAPAYLHEGVLHEFAAGTLNTDTGVEATPDALASWSGRPASGGTTFSGTTSPSSTA